MKQVVLGAAMMLTGVLGLCGLLIGASVSTSASVAAYGAIRTVFESYADGFCFLLFVFLTVAGFVVAIRGVLPGKQ